MADSPLKGTDGPVAITIRTNGAQIPDGMEVVSVRVHRALNRIPEATVVLDAGSIAMQEFPAVDGPTFEIGSGIEIAPYYGSGPEQTVFRGVITGQRLRISASAGPQLELTCRDRAVAMTGGRASALYAALNDAEVMREIVGSAGLDADIAATGDAARDQLRHDVSDWDFLRILAERNGHFLAIDGGNVRAAPPDTSAAAVLTLTLGEDIEEFDAEVSADGLFATARGRGWDDTGQARVEAEGTAPPSAAWGDQPHARLARIPAEREHLTATPVKLDAPRIKAAADSRLVRSALSSIRGSVSFAGSGAAVPGSTLELKGLGNHFGGTALVSAVEHRIAEGRWSTRAQLGLPPERRPERAGGAGTSAAVPMAPAHGLQIGKVIQVHGDPEGRMRIRVSLPLIGEAPAEVWARFAQPYASGGAGIQFLPEVGDEVVVAFMDCEPNAPVVIGALHNPTAAQPEPADAGNAVKTIRTREGLSIAFDDDRKAVTIATPGGGRVTLDDGSGTVAMEDPTGNRIELSKGGILIESPKDITLRATGKIDVTATGAATLTGATVTAAAEGGLTATGGASAELSAGGTTTVRGAMVMIN